MGARAWCSKSLLLAAPCDVLMNRGLSNSEQTNAKILPLVSHRHRGGRPDGHIQALLQHADDPSKIV